MGRQHPPVSEQFEHLVCMRAAIESNLILAAKLNSLAAAVVWKANLDHYRLNQIRLELLYGSRSAQGFPARPSNGRQKSARVFEPA